MTEIYAQTVLIVNPTAGNGRAGRQRELIEILADKFFAHHQTLVTDRPDRAGEYGEAAARGHVDLVICVGGDGTLNEVVNGLMGSGVNKKQRPKLGYLPLGSGSDLARTVGITENIENGLRNIAAGHGKWIDLGRATFVNHEGETVRRYFVNVLSFGLGGEVAGRINRAGKVLGGFLSFFLEMVFALFTFARPLIRLRIDDGYDRQLVCWQVAVANGRYQGGGMHIAPGAEVDDGLLQVTVVGDLSLPEVLLNLPRLYNGRIYSVANVSRLSGRKIEAGSGEKVLLDLDGEQPGRLPVRAEVVPLALWLVY